MSRNKVLVELCHAHSFHIVCDYIHPVMGKVEQLQQRLCVLQNSKYLLSDHL